MMKPRPRGNYILIEQFDLKPASGLVIPSGQPYGKTVPLGQEVSGAWRVVEVGPGKRLDNGVIVPITLKAGDIVIPRMKVDGRQLEHTWMFGGKTLALMNADDIMGVMEGDLVGAVPPLKLASASEVPEN